MAAKVKDGLFLGDAETSQDPEFLELNKISNLVNLAGREVPNVWSAHGLVYLTYNWEDRPDFTLFNERENDQSLADLVEFVDVSLKHGISVLFFSVKGTGRSAAAMCAYFMHKYRWGFEKSYDFVFSKKPDIQLNRGFIQQLFTLDKRLYAQRQQRITATSPGNDEIAVVEMKRWKDWDPSYIISELQRQTRENRTRNRSNSAGRLRQNPLSVSSSPSDELSDDGLVEELLLINSFLNSRNTITSLPGPYHDAYDQPKNFKLRFEGVLQEEDIHMFPTSPPKPWIKPPRGVLKGGNSIETNSNGGASRSNVGYDAMDRREDKIVAGNQPGYDKDQLLYRSESKMPSPVRGSSQGQPVNNISRAKHPRGPYEDIHEEMSPSSARTRQSSRAAEGGDLYEFVGMESSMNAGNNSGQYYGSGGSNRQQDDRIRSSLQSNRDAKDSYSRMADNNAYSSSNGNSNSNRGGRNISTSGDGFSSSIRISDSATTDLESLSLHDLASLPIDAVGLRPAGLGLDTVGSGNSNARTAMRDQRSAATSNAGSAGGRYGTTSGDRDRDADRYSGARPRDGYSSSYGEMERDKREKDPLAAFQQGGGAVRVRRDIDIDTMLYAEEKRSRDDDVRRSGGRSAGTGGAVPGVRSSSGGSQVRGAWTDQQQQGPPRSSSASRRDQQSAGTSAQQRTASTGPQPSTSAQQRAPRVFRHGSPAPNRVVRPQSASAATASSSAGGVRGRGYVDAGGSVASAGSALGGGSVDSRSAPIDAEYDQKRPTNASVGNRNQAAAFLQRSAPRAPGTFAGGVQGRAAPQYSAQQQFGYLQPTASSGRTIPRRSSFDSRDRDDDEPVSASQSIDSVRGNNRAYAGVGNPPAAAAGIGQSGAARRSATPTGRSTTGRSASPGPQTRGVWGNSNVGGGGPAVSSSSTGRSSTPTRQWKF